MTVRRGIQVTGVCISLWPLCSHTWYGNLSSLQTTNIGPHSPLVETTGIILTWCSYAKFNIFSSTEAERPRRRNQRLWPVPLMKSRGGDIPTLSRSKKRSSSTQIFRLRPYARQCEWRLSHRSTLRFKSQGTQKTNTLPVSRAYGANPTFTGRVVLER